LRKQRSKIGDQRSEIRGREKPEVRGRMSDEEQEIGKRKEKTGNRRQMADVRGPKKVEIGKRKEGR
jgi:hypothetical protein